MSDHLLRLSRQPDGVFLVSNGREIFFSTDMWLEASRMISDFNTTGVKEMMNYTPLPTRTPLHANKPSLQPSADDLA